MEKSWRERLQGERGRTEALGSAKKRGWKRRRGRGIWSATRRRGGRVSARPPRWSRADVARTKK
eukprot:51634-Rhodomonas_salina.1